MIREELAGVRSPSSPCGALGFSYPLLLVLKGRERARLFLPPPTLVVSRVPIPCDRVRSPRHTSTPTKALVSETCLKSLAEGVTQPAAGGEEPRRGGVEPRFRRAAPGPCGVPPRRPSSAPSFSAGRNLHPEPGSTWRRARDGWAQLGSPSAGRFHPYRAPGQWHVRHGVQGLRQGGCGRVVSEVSRRRAPDSCASKLLASPAG